MLTLASVPVLKRAGASVLGGTLNTTGAFRFTAAKVGRDTVLAHIGELVRQAQAVRAPIARIADVVSGWFTVGVLAVAIITFAVWLFSASAEVALLHAVTVLVIACPCA